MAPQTSGTELRSAPDRCGPTNPLHGCGSGLLADEQLRHDFGQRTGYDEDALADIRVLDPAAAVGADVERVLSDPRISRRITVSGHVYDVHTGLITTIFEPESPTVSAPAVAA